MLELEGALPGVPARGSLVWCCQLQGWGGGDANWVTAVPHDQSGQLLCVSDVASVKLLVDERLMVIVSAVVHHPVSQLAWCSLPTP